MRFLYFDTETTGTISKIPQPVERAPHVVQLAAMLVCTEVGLVHSINAMIQPDGWEIPAGAAAVHGISTDRAKAYGLPARNVMGLFSQMVRQCDVLVAHNIAFDLGMIAYEMTRQNAPNVAAEKQHFCTMLATKDLLKIPGFYGDWKWPKLEESYRFLFGEMFDNAHDAMADLYACQRIHKHLLAPPVIHETE